jgi:BarA-like signal transduction histidine kinase
MNQIKFLTPAQMNAMIAEQQADLGAIQTTLEQKLIGSPAAAQAKRLVAMGLAKQAAAILQQAASSAQHLSVQATPSAAEVPQEHADSGLLGVVVQLAEDVAAGLAEMLDVDISAIAPFLVECNSIMLALSSDLLNQAKDKLAEADAIEAVAS